MRSPDRILGSLLGFFSLRNYLVDLGVPSGRLRTVSYGEAKPAVRGHDESAWRWNRRSQFRLNR